MSFELWIFNVTIFSLSFTEFLEPPLIILGDDEDDFSEVGIFA